MTRYRRLVCLAAAATAAAATAAPAQAAPDWTPAADLRDPAREWTAPQLGYAGDGRELGAHLEFEGAPGSAGKLVVTSRGAGQDPKTEAEFQPGTGNTPFALDFDVAPTGAAVVAWQEFEQANPVGRYVFRTAYRAPNGTWEQPVTIASDDKLNVFALPVIDAAIGDDGTAVAGAAHREPGPDAEFQPDNRVDVRVHSPAGSWDAATQLSDDDKSAQELKVGVDRNGSATAVYSERTSEGAKSSTGDDVSTVKVRRYSPSNALWSAGGDVGTGTATQATRLQLGVAADGRAVVAFQAANVSTRFTAATRRSSAAGAFPASGTVSGSAPSMPLAAGVAPDGSAYVLVANDDGTAKDIKVIRGTAGQPFAAPKPLAPHDGFPEGAIGFRGNDAFFLWTAPGKGVRTAHAAAWPAGAADPEAQRDLDTGSASGPHLAADREGSIVAVWDRGSAGRYAAFDGTAPRTTGSEGPAAGQIGQELAMSAGFADLFSPVADPEWDFGDGARGTGTSVRHVYAQPGTYTVTVTSRDALGNERRQTSAVTVAAAPEQTPPAQPQPPLNPSADPTDTLAPTLKLKLPAKKVRNRRAAWQTLRGTVADAQPSSGIKRIEVTAFRPKDKRKKVRTAKLAGSAWKLKLPKLTRGAWTFRVRVVDNAGNASKTVQQKVKLR